MLIGIGRACGLVVAGSASAQPVPLPPAPQPKAARAARRPAAVRGRARQAQRAGATDGGSFFPFKIPGFGQPGTGAFDASQRALIDRVNVYLMSIQLLTGDFVQVGADGRASRASSICRSPAGSASNTIRRARSSFIADGSSVVVRDRKLMTQDLYPLSQTPLRFLLADRIDLMRETNVISVSADDTFVSLLIEEKQTLRGSHKVLLMFSAKDTQLKQWTVTDPQGFDTTVALYNLDMPAAPDPEPVRIDYPDYRGEPRTAR